MSKTVKVFVYGTLRRGYGNHRLMLHAKSTLISEAVTAEKYALYADGIPYVREDKEVSQIVGEVFDVPEENLGMLDRLEGHPKWYIRKEVVVQYPNGTRDTAWIYFNPNYRGQLIESGNYIDIAPRRMEV